MSSRSFPHTQGTPGACPTAEGRGRLQGEHFPPLLSAGQGREVTQSKPAESKHLTHLEVREGKWKCQTSTARDSAWWGTGLPQKHTQDESSSSLLIGARMWDLEMCRSVLRLKSPMRGGRRITARPTVKGMPFSQQEAAFLGQVLCHCSSRGLRE